MVGFDRFHFTSSAHLPRLAWCARVVRGERTVSVHLGEWVERDDRGFYEGAWSGAAGRMSFDKSLTFAGSGARIAADGIDFASATHTLDPLHLMQLPNEVLCSNSLHFLLAQAEDAIDTRYLYYDADLMTIMFGTHKFQTPVPTANGHHVHQFYNCNVLVTPDLRFEKRDKPMPPAFANFDTYANFLFSETAALTRNASDPSRRHRYEPLATISSGYDSPACAVIAKAAGCRQAMTFTTARANFEDREDSGKPIAACLGLDVVEFNYFAKRLDRSDFPEAEFIATGHGGDDVVMIPAEDLLPGRIVYTGYHGDKIWDRHNRKVSPYIIRGDTSGCSLGEFRLRVGFINLPVPFIGCTQHAAVHRISNSPQMMPWTLGNDYDRPVPRRIVEQAGVPRELFGQKKKAITMPYQSNRGINPPMQKILCEVSYRDFDEFVRPIKHYRRLYYKLYYDLMHALHAFNLRAVNSGKLKRALGVFGLPGPKEVKVPWRFSKPRAINS
ncbi:MAG TPA: hypothetical protein VFL54_10910, partial [Gammaproteobacteria bacterium]|nr:hypothetical protein [Gammaproteobacteria bacterium]